MVNCRKFFVMFMIVAVTFFAGTSITFAEEHVITVNGIGTAKITANANRSLCKSWARQAAKLDALRQLAEGFKGIEVDLIDDNENIAVTLKVNTTAEDVRREFAKARMIGEPKFTIESNLVKCELRMAWTLK